MKVNLASYRFRLLDRFILKELSGPFFFGMVAFTIILVAGSLLFKIADLVIQRGVSVGVVIRLFLYYLPRRQVVELGFCCGGFSAQIDRHLQLF